MLPDRISAPDPSPHTLAVVHSRDSAPVTVIPWLDSNAPFPPLDNALVEPNGLLAAGADLSPTRIVDAYRRGIYPWYNEGQPVLWWSPDPRMVLYVAEFKASRSLAKRTSATSPSRPQGPRSDRSRATARRSRAME